MVLLATALCKLVGFLPECLHSCVYSEPGSDSSGSFWSCGISPSFSTHQFKAMPFFYLRHLDHRDGCLVSPYLFAIKLVEYPGGLVCDLSWEEVFGESSSHEHHFVSVLMIIHLIPLVFIAILYIIIYIKLKSQKTPGEQSANAGQQRQQRERNVLKMSIAIVLGFAVCWLPMSLSTGFSSSLHRTYGLVDSNTFYFFALFFDSRKLCHESLYLFHFL